MDAAERPGCDGAVESALWHDGVLERSVWRGGVEYVLTTPPAAGDDAGRDAAVGSSPPAASPPAGVVFVHGLGCHRDECLGFYATLARRIAAAGVASVRFDLPRHASREGGPEPFTVARSVREVFAGLEVLAGLDAPAGHGAPSSAPPRSRGADGEHRPAAAPVVFGASFGGAVAIAAAALAGRRVGRLVLLGPLSDFALLTDTDRARERGLAEALIAGRDVAWDWGVTISPALNFELHTVDLGALFARIQAPIAVVHGDDDDVVPLAASRALAERNPRAALIPLPHTGHVFAATGDETGTSERSRANLDLLADLLTTRTA